MTIKRLVIINFIGLAIFILSCDSGEYKKENLESIIEGGFKNGKPDGRWVYYDENNNIIKEVYYHNTILEMVKFFSDGNLIYIERYEKENITRIAFGDLSSNSGKYLLEVKCVSCHHLKQNSVGPSFNNIFSDKKINTVDIFYNQYHKRKYEGLDSLHKEIPLSKFEIGDIVRYLAKNEDGDSE